MSKTSSPPLLQFVNVTRCFPSGANTVTILDSVNLTIHAGEMVAIIGQSGSGKSTLMNILGCLDSPTSGDYLVAGTKTQKLTSEALASLRRDTFGFIFQRYHLLPHISALANVEIPAIYVGKTKQERRQRAQQLLIHLGLGDRLTYRPNQLSGGQQQRVSIARALMNGGQVILADEPTGALDSQSGRDVMESLSELHRQGHTIIVVTHDEKIANYAQRIIKIQDGKIVADYPNPSPTSTKGIARSALTPPFPHPPSGAAISWASLKDALSLAWVTLNAHRLRTLLTMLGIMIGIASVTSVIALGQGTQRSIAENINALGTHTVNIIPGRGWGDPRARTIHTLVPNDIKVLATQPYINKVSPVVMERETVRYRSHQVDATIKGVNEQYLAMRKRPITAGRHFLPADSLRQAQVAIIDANTRDKLFQPAEDPLGKVIFIGNLPLKIIGVTAKIDSVFVDPGSLEVLLPYSTAMYRLFGLSYFNHITVQIHDNQPNELAERNITRLLTLHHGNKDFFTESTDAIIKTMQRTTAQLSLLISVIAVITLLVGGIGVMNIMLVSVTERTHEIGIRLAVGARRADILLQFLIEAILVCFLGGMIGIMLSFLIGKVFSLFVSLLSMHFSLWAMLTACTTSTLVGVIFGFLPARRAAQLTPTEALARE